MRESYAGNVKESGLADSGHPLVSVVIPFYNQENFLLETVTSVLENGYTPLEIIIIDDGSPVTAEQVLPRGGPWKLIRTLNRGLSAARNRGLAESAGEFLLFLDSDDRLVPGGIGSHVELLRRAPRAALSFGASATVNIHGVRVAPATICRARTDYFLKLLEGNMIATPGAALIRRSVLQEAGGFDESFRMVEDYRLYLRLAIRHEFIRNARCVLDRRIHGNNMSLNLEPMLAATMLALDKLQEEEVLTPEQQRKLAFGRRRWEHEYRPQSDLAYRLRSFYYDLRAMMDVSTVGLVRLREPRA